MLCILSDNQGRREEGRGGEERQKKEAKKDERERLEGRNGVKFVSLDS